MTKILRTLIAVALVSAAGLQNAQAGVFDLASHLEAKQWSVGFEPEVSLSNGTGLGLNFKPKYGVNDLINVQALFGPGTGRRQGRLGLLADFEWFPDYENQPGISTAFFTEYYDLEDGGQLKLGAKPIISKTFYGQGANYTPFVSVPIGWNNQSGRVEGFVQIVLGTMVKLPTTDRWKFTGEAGFDAKNSYSYLSGGVTYFAP